MLTISKPLSAGQARAYHAEEFSNARENYYTQSEQIAGEWHGKLAEKWGLRGEVQEEHFRRLSEGQHPLTGEQLVRHQVAREYANERGEKIKSMEHRAGWDATFSAPKSVSLTALVGGDERVRDAHRASVAVALGELEQYVQARLGGNLPAETTGKWIAAKFEHDSARPVEGYAAPQLHTHVVVFNVTETQDGKSRPLQPRELYKTQQYATAAYRSELAYRLRALGYEIERGQSGQPEIKGYSQEYLEASSPRRRQIEARLADENRRGARAAQIAAHQTREEKLDLPHDEMQARHRAMARAFGDQPEHVIEAAQAGALYFQRAAQREEVDYALTFSRDRNLEREAVTDERALLRDALRRSMGEATLDDVKAGFTRRIEAGGFVEVESKEGAPGRAFTTKEMIDLERDTIHTMREGQDKYPALTSLGTRQDVDQAHGRLSASQHAAVVQILSSHDQVTALEGRAGAGKTTSLAAIRGAAEREGYKVEGFAPTSRAAQKLEEAGIDSSTLQRHLAQNRQPEDQHRWLYVLDESSLASSKQMNEFLHRLREKDRVLLVGDTRQHEAVEAGKPYQQLQEAGIRVARLDEIVRQKDPALKEVVEQLSRGAVRQAMQNLETQGRVHEIAYREQRLREIAREYAKEPSGTLVVSPDNQSREQINQMIHRELQKRGQLDSRQQHCRVLVPRQEITGADRQWAAQYQPGDVARYSRRSKAYGFKAGEYAHVERVDEKENLVVARRANGQEVSYDPRRLHGVTLYREMHRAFSEGDRVQFTAPDRAHHIANRELGTIEKIDASGNIQIQLDSSRTIAFNLRNNPHLDYGYAMTSHSSQGQTTDRVLIHVDTQQAGEKLVNQRFAYVAVSRGRYDAQIYTNDAAKLRERLTRQVSKQSAMESGHEMRDHNQGHSAGTDGHRSATESQAHAQAQGHGMSF